MHPKSGRTKFVIEAASMSPSSDTRPVGITFCIKTGMLTCMFHVTFGIAHNLCKSRYLPRGEETGKHARLQ